VFIRFSHSLVWLNVLRLRTPEPFVSFKARHDARLGTTNYKVSVEPSEIRTHQGCGASPRMAGGSRKISC
jgi:hypothetical protein